MPAFCRRLRQFLSFKSPPHLADLENSPKPICEAFGGTDKGLVRPTNQDALWYDADMGAFAVADGLGGHQSGEVASTLAIRQCHRVIAEAWSENRWIWPSSWGRMRLEPQDDLPPKILRHALWVAHRFLIRSMVAQPEWAGMGTTLTAAIISGQRLHIAHVGDSRLYLFRDGQLKQCTRDHSYLQFLIDAGLVRSEEARNHPARTRLLQSLGGKSMAIDHSLQVLQEGDRLLLCTDGLHHMVPNEALTLLMGQSNVSPNQLVHQLIQEANSQGGRDNIALIVVFLASGEAPRRQGPLP
ncbi:Serine/threonine-protein phosphatase [Sulfidibacter corallicola]